ncbi:nitroreductase family protein [Nitrincola alkalisediminis]|uniref:nitroreductase family protein n=1 Tax=Nitrincola alkalisediminis TaxID=1366656 RepID=UPI001874B5CC|nr:nitroreductase family protein [Nitrincola alkalisediminis]
MQALDLLLTRVSSPVLDEPAPTPEQLDLIFRAAFRAPDHGGLRPYRFLQIEGQGRERLGKVFVEAARVENPAITDAELDKLAGNPLRAPMILVAIACLQDHPKVPLIEQQITAGCAAHSMILAAFAQGIDSIWRSGAMAFNRDVHRLLGLEANEEIIGFIYMGKARKHRVVPCPSPGEFVQRWGHA